MKIEISILLLDNANYWMHLHMFWASEKCMSDNFEKKSDYWDANRLFNLKFEDVVRGQFKKKGGFYSRTYSFRGQM